MHLTLPATVLLLTATSAAALPILTFTDTRTFATQATEVLIADCLDPDPDPGPKVNVTVVSVDVVRVLKGTRRPGGARLATIGQPMEKGRRYLMATFGGSALGTDFLAQAELAVVEVPAGFDLKALDGKTVAEQMQLVFDARREQVRVRLIQLEQEKKALEKTVPKPPAAPRLAPPEVKFAGAEVRGAHTHLLFDLANPNSAQGIVDPRHLPVPDILQPPPPGLPPQPTK